MIARAIITLGVLFITLSVGLSVMEQSVESAVEADMGEEPEHLCNGVWGCEDTSNSWGDIGVFVGVMLVVLVIGNVVHSPPRGLGGTSKDGLTVVKEQYVNGDIETVLELEQRLDEEMGDQDD